MTAPREWPPASVWLAIALLVGSPAGVAVYGVAAGERYLDVLGVGLLLVTGGPAVGLLRGWPSGPVGGLWVAGLGAVWLGLPALGSALDRSGLPGAIRSPGAGFLAWAACLVALLRWPETRRWCGSLPPADPDAG